jgi:hypothetical protein
MSGNAALSAARKRRASSTPVGGGAGSSGSQFSAYYNRTTPTTQQLMNQTFPEHNSKQPQSQYTLPRDSAPNVPINIYENIELIKQQIAARTTLIQTQGSAIPPDKLRVLQKQNEIQNQILIQKMAIAKQMEQAEQRQLQEQEQLQQQQMLKMAIPSMDEPEFIYEKGIPRKNPKYKTPAEIEAIRQAQAQARTQARTQAVFQQQQQQQPQNQGPVRMTPFVSMISETGVIPPPIVILKSHDAKLKEHDDVIQEMAQQMDYLLERVSSNGSLPVIREETRATTNDTTENTENADDEPEQELLMDVVINDLTNSREFVEGIVDKIVNETNLSEVIMKIEPLVKENQELRSLIHSQQQMMNEMNTMLLRLLNTNGTVVSSSQVTDLDKSQEVFKDDGLDVDGLYQPEITEIILSNTGQVEIEFHQEDSEPAQIIDTEEEENDEPDNSPTNDTVADAAAAATEDEPDNSPTTDATEDDAEADDGTTTEAEAEAAYDLSSDKPHFPIALIVNEI